MIKQRKISLSDPVFRKILNKALNDYEKDLNLKFENSLVIH